MIHSTHSSRKSRFLLSAVLLIVSLAAVMPAFAADPEEADPDPELTQPSSSTVTEEIVVTDLAELYTERLAPGRYIVRLVDDEGRETTFEIVVNW